MVPTETGPAEFTDGRADRECEESLRAGSDLVSRSRRRGDVDAELPDGDEFGDGAEDHDGDGGKGGAGVKAGDVIPPIHKEWGRGESKKAFPALQEQPRPHVNFEKLFSGNPKYKANSIDNCRLSGIIRAYN